MFAQCCGTLIVPYKKEDKPRSCECGKSHIWWEVLLTGKIAVYTEDKSFVSILGLHNGLLNHDMGGDYTISKDDIKDIIAKTPDNYLFSTYESLIIRVKIGMTGDMRWATKEEYDKL